MMLRGQQLLIPEKYAKNKIHHLSAYQVYLRSFLYEKTLDFQSSLQQQEVRIEKAIVQQFIGINMIEGQPWFQFLRKDLSCVVPHQQQLGGIYISSLPTAQTLPLLQEHHINYVLSAAKGVKLSLVTSSLVKHLILPAEDHSQYDLTQFFHQSISFIEEGRQVGSVLVHCMAGISRSATLVAAYLMKKRSISAQQAVQELKLRRKQVNPNPGFLQQLSSFKTSGDKHQKQIHLQGSLLPTKTQLITLQESEIKWEKEKKTTNPQMESIKRSQKENIQSKECLSCENNITTAPFTSTVTPDKPQAQQTLKMKGESARLLKISAGLSRKDKIKGDEPSQEPSLLRSQSLQSGQSLHSSTSRSRPLSRTEAKIERIKVSMAGVLDHKLEGTTNFNSLLSSSIYRNKLRLH